MARDHPTHIEDGDGNEWDDGQDDNQDATQEHSNTEELAPLNQYEGWDSALPEIEETQPRSSVPVGHVPANPESQSYFHYYRTGQETRSDNHDYYYPPASGLDYSQMAPPQATAREHTESSSARLHAEPSTDSHDTSTRPAKKSSHRDKSGNVSKASKLASGKKCSVCSSSFRNNADLERHKRVVHGDVLKFKCDYRGCLHEYSPVRLDHYREHLEKFHKEDLPKGSNGYSDEWWAKWWAERDIREDWWRCNKCLTRVVKGNEWVCLNCSTYCSQERIDERESRFGNSMQSEPHVPTTTDYAPQANIPDSAYEEANRSQSNIPLAPVATTSALPDPSQDNVLHGWVEEVVMLERYVDIESGEEMYILCRDNNRRIVKRASEWSEGQIRPDGVNAEPCFVHRDQGGRIYWTKTFDVKGKGRR
ncbi:hypothetical protein GLAREA_10124 [Glarea lozoyensis ATCC 20868]|uniref:C2H2-type domain-containing protein n=1 Tax=Glarea lozoyensis (strain ATCC 20868 / MF5171) TaxID=1116229 RepID=S3D9L2_GLAL2|nr:uncharacterized protein GLAREA_10124 [Glarea lozoyensis ATCC 20868]EPE34430.1 hypothetical protein GLAREA_10124 [Glarea lozoyensis ATCC 20868]